MDQVELMTSRLVHQIRIKLNEIDIEKLEVNKRTQIVGDIRKLFAKHISFVQCVVELLIHPFLKDANSVNKDLGQQLVNYYEEITFTVSLTNDEQFCHKVASLKCLNWSQMLWWMLFPNMLFFQTLFNSKKLKRSAHYQQSWQMYEQVNSGVSSVLDRFVRKKLKSIEKAHKFSPSTCHPVYANWNGKTHLVPESHCYFDLRDQYSFYLFDQCFSVCKDGLANKPLELRSFDSQELKEDWIMV